MQVSIKIYNIQVSNNPDDEVTFSQCVAFRYKRPVTSPVSYIAQLEKVGSYRDVLPLKAAWRFQFNTVWGIKSELQMNPIPFHLGTVWGAMLKLHRECVMDWNKPNKEGSWKLRSSFKLFVDQVHEILGQRRRPFILSNALARLSVSRFTIKSRSRRKPKKCKSFWPPIFFRRDDPNFSMADC